MPKKSFNAASVLTILLIVIFAIVFFFLIRGPGGGGEISNSSISNNVAIKNGIQYVTISAKWGYSPKNTTIDSMPTKLIMKTEKTYDCSSALVIRDVGYRAMLPASGETEIDLGTPQSGKTMRGLCSMGMYNFSILVR